MEDGRTYIYWRGIFFFYYHYYYYYDYLEHVTLASAQQLNQSAYFQHTRELAASPVTMGFYPRLSLSVVVRFFLCVAMDACMEGEKVQLN